MSAPKPLAQGQVVQTQTSPVACPVIEIDLYRATEDDIPAGHVTIDDFVAESEKDPQRRVALEEARKWIADSFYGDDGSIRALRLRAGLSQAKLAVLATTTQPHIARIEMGSSDCQVGTLERIAHALGLDTLVVVKAFLNTREKV